MHLKLVEECVEELIEGMPSMESIWPLTTTIALAATPPYMLLIVGSFLTSVSMGTCFKSDPYL